MRRFAWTLVVLAGLACTARAQVLYGTLVGAVQDASGAAVPGATVTITNTDNNQARQAVTGDTGAYNFPNVLPGPYRVGVQAAGFQAFTQEGVTVTINTVTRLDVQLQLGQINESVTVAGQAAALQTDKADVHADLTSKEVSSLPLGHYRNYQSLINLVPGASPVRTQNAVNDTPDRSLSTNINGTAYNNNNTRVDGATNVFASMPHHTAYVPPVESIETVNVSTNAFDAEQGLAGGAAITVFTKSGTNQLHGALFENHSNSAWNARNFFFVGSRNPKNLINTYGGAIGGPVKKDKLFYFVSWEGVKERINFNKTVTVPTAANKQGDFSASNVRLFDPLTGAADGSGRIEFANATVPLSRQSAITRQLAGLVPVPNLSGTSANYFSTAPQAFDRDSIDVKVNWNKSSKLNAFAKYSRLGALFEGQFSLGAAGGTCVCSGGSGTGDSTIQLASLGATYTISPSFLVDGTLGFTRIGQAAVGPDFGKNIGLDILGIPGTNGPDIRASGLPVFAIDGYETLGNADTWSPVFRADNSWTYTTNFSQTNGRHEFRFGVDLSKQAMNQWQPNIGGRSPRGGFSFTSGVTGLRGGPATNQFNALAGFLLGLPQNFGKAIQYYAPSTTRQWLEGLYFRDRWQATQHLTVTLGLRWEYYPIFTRDHSGPERYDYNDNLVYLGGFGSTPRNAGWTTSKKLFAPRVGLAYRLGGKTVVRTGYGISIDPYPIGTAMKRAWPSVVNQEYLGANTLQPAGTIEQGIPFFTGPDVSPGVLPLPLSATTRTMNPGQFDRGYIQSWNFFLEREVGGGFTASAGYVGTRSIRQTVIRNLNSAAPGAGPGGTPLAVRFGRTVTTELHTPFGTANYNALQTSLNRRFHGGSLIKASYTYSKAINFNDNSDSSLTWNWDGALKRNRAAAGYDRTHVFRLANVAELPFGGGKRWANSRPLAKAVLGGWQVNGILSAYTGVPFTVTASGTSLNAPGNTQTADQVNPVVEKLGGIGRLSPYYDPTAFRPVTEVRFGTTGRNILRGPGLVNLDLGLFRQFGVTERVKVQFRAEAFNISNTPHFANPSGNASGTGFLTITSVNSEDNDASAGPRAVRFGLRVSF